MCVCSVILRDLIVDRKIASNMTQELRFALVPGASIEGGNGEGKIK